MSSTLFDRLGRRGTLTITVEDGTFDVRLVTPGPYVGGRATTDKADLFSYCRLGAKDWHGEGRDLAALLAQCAEESRPPFHDIDGLRWSMSRRRESRTYGPPLPDYRKWHGWRPGDGRWLRVSTHAAEYLARYHADRAIERDHEAAQRASELRRVAAERRRVRKVLADG